jgi:CheY-like chemotaxis protein
MSIVYGIVKQHQGFMHVYSEPEVGTTFRIYLPLVGGDATLLDPGDTLAQPTGGTETILVVEDEVAVRELVAEVLVSSGYQVIMASDGQDAVAQFMAHRDDINLILMDMIMPRLSGKEASDQILQHDPRARIIFISGYTMDFIRQRDLVDERTELIMKPVQPFELLRKIRELLDRESTSTP